MARGPIEISGFMPSRVLKKCKILNQIFVKGAPVVIFIEKEKVNSGQLQHSTSYFLLVSERPPPPTQWNASTTMLHSPLKRLSQICLKNKDIFHFISLRNHSTEKIPHLYCSKIFQYFTHRRQGNLTLK